MATAGRKESTTLPNTKRTITARRELFGGKESTETFEFGFGDDETDMEDQENEENAKRSLFHLAAIL